MPKNTTGLIHEGRPKDAKDKVKRKPSKALNAHLDSVRPNNSRTEGRPSKVIRTHGHLKALAWWDNLTPLERAQWVETAYTVRQSGAFAAVTHHSSEEESYDD